MGALIYFTCSRSWVRSLAESCRILFYFMLVHYISYGRAMVDRIIGYGARGVVFKWSSTIKKPCMHTAKADLFTHQSRLVSFFNIYIFRLVD